jgi:DTW domain-containing protein YfiP
MELRQFRERCHICFFWRQNCYCRHIKAFDPKIKFVILIQYREARKHIATGRLSHLCLKNSELIIGYNYTQEARVNEILADPSYFPVVLYPGKEATNLTQTNPKLWAERIPKNKVPVIFVIDGTWTNARKTMQRSLNLQQLPQICFDPPHPSNFRLRKQPQEFCFSTVEAIHHTIDLLGPSFQLDTASRPHDHLLTVFDLMMDKQIEYMKHLPRFTPALT